MTYVNASHTIPSGVFVLTLAIVSSKATATDANYFPPPESAGGWRSLNDPNDIKHGGGMEPAKLDALKQWLLDSDKRNFAAVVVRHGYIVLEVERGNSAKTDARRVASVSKALVLDDGNERLALVVCDIIGFHIDMVNEMRATIGEQTGIEPDNVMITCTHTHCGPNLRAADEAYVETLKTHVAEAVSAAAKNVQEARLGAAKGECRVASNRRHPNSPSGPYNLYKYPEGIIDPTVMVLRIEDTSGNLIGLVTNYAAHPVGWGSHELGISRDFPGFALDVLESVWGRDIVAIYLQGCCGNLNLNWVWDKPEEDPMPRRRLPEERAPRLREVRRVGQILGGETLKVAETITDFTSDVVLKAARTDVEVRIKEDLSEKMQERIADARKNGQLPERGRRGSIYDAVAAGKDTLTTEVQVFRMGDCFLVGLPSEVFVEYQIEIRKRSGAAYTFVSELANDSISYIPTPEAYEQGGYEVRSSSLAPDAGKTLVDAAIGLVEALK